MKKSNKMNLVIINDFDYIQGGATKVAIETANLFAEKNNYNVYYFCGVHGDNSNLSEKVIKVCTNQKESISNKFSGIINNLYNFKAERELKKLLKTLDSNNTIIHVHGWTKALSSSIFNAIFKLKFKMVLTMHDYFTACPNGGYFNYKKNEICHLNPMSFKCIKCNCDSRNYAFKIYRIIRQFIQNRIVKLNDRLTDVISISDFSEKILKETLNSNVKIHRVFNPVDLKPTTSKVNFKYNDYYIYVGRVSKEKGVEVFCKVISNLDKQGIVVGDGDELEKLKNKYPKVKYVGWQPSDKVKDYLVKAKALIFPSLWYETAGLTVLEALTVGIPCIVNANTSASEFIKDKRNGYLYHNEKELEEIIKGNKVDSLKEINIDFNHDYFNDLDRVYKKINEV